MKKTCAILLALGLSAPLVSAQAVPGLISYQGQVVDSTGTGLGTGTPVNRKMIFRLFDASTGGTRLWSEEQTVTVANGVFSVVLGQGIAASYNGSPENPRPSLLTVFNGTDRYLELVVDNGDNTLNNTDTPITPRQRLTATAFAVRASIADGVALGTDLSLRDSNHGLGWYGGTRLFSGLNIDGPVLYGYSGGALGSNQNGTQKTALRWDSAGQVGIGGVSVPSATLDVNGTIKSSSDLTVNGRASVGVGSINTAYSFQVKDSGANTGRIQVGGTAAGGERKIVSFGDGDNTYVGENGSDNLMELKAGKFYFNSGNVGIGKDNPGEKLDVQGNITASGNVNGTHLNLSGNVSAAGYVSAVGLALPNSYSPDPAFVGTTGNYISFAHAGVSEDFIGYKSNTFYFRDSVGGGDTSAPNVDAGGTLKAGAGVTTDGFLTTRTQGAYLEWNKDVGFGATYLLNQKGQGGGGIILGEVTTAGVVTETMKVTTGGTTVNGKSVPVGEENLRIVRGSCAKSTNFTAGVTYTSGTANLKGTGYSYKKNYQDEYEITFATAFSDTPTVTMTPKFTSADGFDGGSREFVKIQFCDNTKVIFRVNSDGSNSGHDCAFDFIAVGPR